MSKNNQSEEQTVFTEEKVENENEIKVEKATTSSGLEQNIAGALCYAFWFITGIIFLVMEKDNQFVRFHAMQSIVVSVTVFLFSFILIFIPFIGWIISVLMMPLMLILWAFLMYKAYSGEMFKLPIAGDFAEQQVNKG